jgi:hypothetical protein
VEDDDDDVINSSLAIDQSESEETQANLEELYDDD